MNSKGNNEEAWQALLDSLNDKLQLGLLDHLRRAKSYHLESSILYIVPSNQSDYSYLTQASNLEPLRIFAEDVISGVSKVEIKSCE